MSVAERGLDWAHSLGGIAVSTEAAACRQGEDGAVIAFALVAANYITKVGAPELDEEALAIPTQASCLPLCVPWTFPCGAAFPSSRRRLGRCRRLVRAAAS